MKCWTLDDVFEMIEIHLDTACSRCSGLTSETIGERQPQWLNFVELFLGGDWGCRASLGVRIRPTMLLLGPIAFGLALLMSMNMAIRKIKPPRVRLISDIKTFEAFLLSEKASQLSKVKVMGNFSGVTDDHPVVEAVISRWKANSKPGQRHHGDVKKIALSIEGGGMRGCVSAGATAALNILGLDNTIDVVYGSSAGAMIAAFFISRQVSGVQIYHDILPIAGKRFIDKGKLLFAAGLPGWLNIFLRTNTGTVDEIMSFIPDPEALEMKHSKMINSRRLSNVFNLDFLLVQVMGVLQPLDWEIFTKNEASQPLRIVASSLKTLTPLVMSRENKNYGDMPSLLSCIRASMSVPGITGNLMALSENNRKKNFFPLGHALSVPFSVHTRKKVEHLYETSKVTNVDLTVESAVTNETNMKMKVTESKTMKSKILQQFIAIAASALAILLQLIRQLRGDVGQKWMSEKNSAANEIYGIKENSDNISQQKRNNDIIHKSNEGTKESAIKSTIEKSRGDDKINKKSVRISVEDCEPIVDAFLCEPLPYRSAVQEGASHVIVLRTRPDPCPVLGKGPGVFEKLIAKR